MKYTFYLPLITYAYITLHFSCLYTQPLTINTIYGNFIVNEPVLIELFNHPIMERIKHVRQYGVSDYIIKQKKEYTRYEHCVGVWALLKLFGASLEEQIAGLLHDASHTVFSHVGDKLFCHHSANSSYQDDIHEWYLKHYNIHALLAQYDIALADILHKNGTHLMLEQDLPYLCADRLEYNLQAGILTDLLTLDDIHLILHNLEYDNGNWFFTDIEMAKKLALVSLYNTEHVWGNPLDQCIYHITAAALQRALEIQLITIDDIHFSTDALVWDKLWISNDTIIMQYLKDMINCAAIINQYKPYIKAPKFRGLDPLIQSNDTFYTLTEIDDEYYEEYNRVKTQLAYRAIRR